MKSTKQIEFWNGNFGKEYTLRNNIELNEWNEFYINRYGRTKLHLNESFIGNLNKDIKIFTGHAKGDRRSKNKIFILAPFPLTMIINCLTGNNISHAKLINFIRKD